MSCEDVFKDKESMVRYIREVNGLLGAVECDAPEKIRKLVQMLNEKTWIVDNVFNALEVLYHSERIDEGTKKYIKSIIKKYYGVDE